MSTETDTVAQTHPFQAEVAELLHLMVHSVYSETDIFLRELISNASDACDKLRYEAIAAPDLLASDSALAIRITPDAAAGTLTRRRQRHRHGPAGADRQSRHHRPLGHARLPRARWPRPRTAAGLIGQFGVGFYSAFMVADRIEVTSRRAGAAEAWVWRPRRRQRLRRSRRRPTRQAGACPRGTAIVLHLKDDAKHYLEPLEIERIVGTYSDHILFPIELATPTASARQINAASALWQRSKSEVKPEDYTQAYRTIAGRVRRAGG